MCNVLWYNPGTQATELLPSLVISTNITLLILNFKSHTVIWKTHPGTGITSNLNLSSSSEKSTYNSGEPESFFIARTSWKRASRRAGEARHERRNLCSVKLVLEFPDVALDLHCGAIWSQSAQAQSRGESNNSIYSQCSENEHRLQFPYPCGSGVFSSPLEAGFFFDAWQEFCWHFTREKTEMTRRHLQFLNH